MLQPQLPKNNNDPLTEYQAPEFNSIFGETLDYVVNSGQVLNGLITTQMTTGAANYTSTADYYTASGTNTYIATPVAPNIGIGNAGNSYVDGMRFRVSIPNTNTGVSTLSVNGFGSLDIVKTSSDIDLDAGDLISGLTAEFIYNGGNNNFRLVHNGSLPYNAFPDGGSAFRVLLSAPVVIPSPSPFEIDPVPFSLVDFNLNSNYDPISFKYTAPVKGLYYFTFSAGFVWTITAYPPDVTLMTASTRLRRNGVSILRGNVRTAISSLSPLPSNQASGNALISTYFILNKGDEIDTSCGVDPVSASLSPVISGAGADDITYFTGNLVKQLP